MRTAEPPGTRPVEPAENSTEGRPAPTAPRAGRRGLANVSSRFRHVWYRDTYVYVRRWRTNLLPPLFEPFIYLGALGLGVGYYVDEIEGVDYLSFVAPGIIATTAILRATFECTYGSYFRMAFQGTFDSIISTPVNPEEVSLGEIMWGATRSFINVVTVVALLATLGRVPLVWIPFILVLQFVAGVNFGALSLIITSRVRQAEYFNFFLSGIIFPAELLTGAFFPVSRLPDFIEPFAWLVPLTSMIDLTRDMMLDRLDAFSLIEVVYILATTVLFLELALRLMRRRLIG